MRRALKISGWVIAGVALTVLLLMASLYVAGNTDNGRRLIERITAQLTSGHVSLQGLAGEFPQHLTLERLELKDDRGVWLSAEHLSASWSPFALLENRVEVNSLHAAVLDMERLPESPPSPKNSAPPSIPRIDAANVSIDLTKLGAELAGAPASLVLSGNAHLRTVLDMVIDARAHRIDGDGEYSLQLRFDPKRMDAHLIVHEPAGGPLENILQLPGLGALAVTLDLKGPRSAERLDLSIDAGSLRARAEGSFNLNDLSSDLDVAVDSAALAPRPDLGWERASLHGHWQGSIKEPKANAHLQIENLRVPGAVQLASLTGELAADAGKASLQGLVNGLVIPGPRPRLLADAPIKFDATMRLDAPLRPLELSASHRLFALHGTADTAAASDGGRSVVAELRLPSVTELAAIAGQDVQGSALLKAQVHVDPKATRLTLNATAALHDGTELWSGMVGQDARLELQGEITEEVVQLDSLKLSGDKIVLNAGGEIARDSANTMKLRWDAQLSDMSTLAPMLAGALKASGTLSGPSASFAADLQASAALAVRGAPPGTLTASAKLRGLPTAPSGTMLAQGSLDGAPLNLDISMERSSGGALHALIHRGEWRSVRAGGEINLEPSSSQARGQVNLSIGQLADLDDFLGAKLGGGLTASLTLHPLERRTNGQITLDAHDVSLGQFLGNVQLSAQGATDAMGFKLDVQSPKLAGAKTTLTAAGSLNIDKKKILVSSASAKYREQEVKLLAPAQVALANGVALDGARLGAGHAVLEVKGTILPTLDAHLALTGVGPAEVNGFLPDTLASGKLEVHADLGGRLDEPTGKVVLSASEVRMADDSALGLPAVNLKANAQLLGDVAEVDAKLDAGSASQLSLTGRAPLAAGGVLDLKMNGKLDIGMINPVLEARGQHAAGDLTVDASVTGDVGSPQIDGSVQIAKGSIRDYSRGFSLTAITADMVGTEGMLEIKNFTATAAPGTVTVTGKVGLLQKDIPVDIQIKAQNAQPLVSKLVTANLDADLHLAGTARDRLDINGTVQLHRTLIGIPSSLPPNVAVLDVRRRGKAAVVVPEKQLVIGMDITVQAPQQILVQGRGLDAEMGGDLHLTGTTDTPLVTGGFDLQRGNFSLAGSKLNFSSGRVSFNGAGLKGKIDPTLDFVAQTTVSDTTATLQIAGLADAPQFAFTSTPSKPQDEIMALLLFGAPPQQLSALQLAQIGAVLASLSGVGGDSGLNPLAKLQKSLGLDRLNVGSGTVNTPTGPENAGASIEAGRYISKRVYVEAKQSTQGTSQLEADIDLTKHLKLQTRVGNGTGSVLGTTPENDPGSSIGLTYQFEY